MTPCLFLPPSSQAKISVPERWGGEDNGIEEQQVRNCSEKQNAF